GPVSSRQPARSTSVSADGLSSRGRDARFRDPDHGHTCSNRARPSAPALLPYRGGSGADRHGARGRSRGRRPASFRASPVEGGRPGLARGRDARPRHPGFPLDRWRLHRCGDRVDAPSRASGLLLRMSTGAGLAARTPPRTVDREALRADGAARRPRGRRAPPVRGRRRIAATPRGRQSGPRGCL
ncbi:MAG: hypothetical protein AVDCRST_MAG90-3199, partial [uncultured Microvirga sp.]